MLPPPLAVLHALEVMKLGDTMQVLQAVQVLGDGEEAVCAGAGRAARGGSGSGFVAGSYKGKTGIVQKLTPQKAHVETRASVPPAHLHRLQCL